MQTTSHLSRRALLSGSAASLALPFLARGARAQPAPIVSEAALRELQRCIPGGVLGPNDPRFVRLTQPENLRYFNPPANPGEKPDPDAPYYVVLPRTREEVVCAIKWARDQGLPLVPRSGGHSYAGCSTVPGVVINMTAMQSVRRAGGVIVAGGGARFGDMLAALRNMPSRDGFGRYTVTHGRCAGVGLSAYLMGGGYSLDSPHAGMGCDRVVGVEMVLADGSVVLASRNDHANLFWAIRGGGGGNLGIATEWHLDPIEVSKVTAFYGVWRLNDNAQQVFSTLLRALEAAPDTMGADMTVSTTSSTFKGKWPYQIKLSCQLHGSIKEFNDILGTALAAADHAEKQVCSYNDCSAKTLLELPYWDAQEFFDETSVPNRYQETSLFARYLSDNVLAELFSRWKKWPGTVSAARWTVYRTGGQINVPKPSDMAFVHRDSRWMISTDIDWSDCDDKPAIDANLKWQRDVQNALGGMPGMVGSYYNFPDPGLENHALQYWGTNLARLISAKRQVDPNCVFNPPRNQGIPC